MLLPLILLQAAGLPPADPLRASRSACVFGGGVGVLYAVTTISGPPLAVVLSNQGLTKKDFRAALGFIRLAESSFTAIAYYYAGLYSVESFGLIPYILPSIVIGVPIGAVLIQRIRPETFRRVCMSFDAWVVGFGLSTLVRDLALIQGNSRWLILIGVGLLDTWLLYRFFSVTLPALKQADPERRLTHVSTGRGGGTGAGPRAEGCLRDSHVRRPEERQQPSRRHHAYPHRQRHRSGHARAERRRRCPAAAAAAAGRRACRRTPRSGPPRP